MTHREDVAMDRPAFELKGPDRHTLSAKDPSVSLLEPVPRSG